MSIDLPNIIQKKAIKRLTISAAFRTLFMLVAYLIFGNNFLYGIIGVVTILFVLSILNINKQFDSKKEQSEYRTFNFVYYGMFLAMICYNYFTHDEQTRTVLDLFELIYGVTIGLAIILLVQTIRYKGSYSFKGANASYIALVGGLQSLAFLIIGDAWAVFFFLFCPSMLEVALIIYIKSKTDKENKFFDQYFKDKTLFVFNETIKSTLNQ